MSTTTGSALFKQLSGLPSYRAAQFQSEHGERLPSHHSSAAQLTGSAVDISYTGDGVCTGLRQKVEEADL